VGRGERGRRKRRTKEGKKGVVKLTHLYSKKNFLIIISFLKSEVSNVNIPMVAQKTIFFHSSGK
jgi:hypothetical protein